MEYKTYPEGKIIALVGTSKCGKSFLTDKLAEHYGAVAIKEGDPSSFPQSIRDNLGFRGSKEISDTERNLRNLETILWFRTERVKDYLGALSHKKDGRYVVMDTYWMTNQTYIPAMLTGFERELASEMARVDRETYTHPDATVLLNVSDGYIRNRIEQDAGRNGRSFEEQEEDIKIVCETGRQQKDFFQEHVDNFLCVDRDRLDFQKPEDFSNLLDQLERVLYRKRL
jgi:deoxyadenosine/deoxycytidine kinase